MYKSLEKKEQELSTEKKQRDKAYSQSSDLQDQLEQMRQENISLLQKIGDLDQLFQEIDYKLKNTEAEKDLFKQQLQLEERAKHEDSVTLKQQY